MVIESILRNNSKKIALCEKDRQITYEQMNKQIDAIANWLKSELFDGCSNIAVCLNSGIDYFLTAIASIKIGCSVILMYEKIQSNSVESLMEKLDNLLVVTDEKHLYLFNSNSKIKPLIFNQNVIVEKTDSLKLIEDGSFIFMTSGTTGGKPKFARLPIDFIDLKLQVIDYNIKLNEEDVNLLVTPLCFIQSLWVTLLHLYKKCTVVFNSFSVNDTASILKGNKITTFSSTPSIIRGLMPHLEKYDLRLLIVGGDYIDSQTITQLAEVFPNTLYTNVYGCTETSAADIILNPIKIFEKRNELYSIGKPTNISSIKILAGNREAGIGQEGEILIKSPCVIESYIGESSKILDNEGYFHTGDIAYRDNNGFIFYKGREKDIIVYNGIKISPVEIESFILKSGYAKEAVVVGKKHGIYGQVIKTVIVPADNSVTKEKINDFLKGYLESYKIPREVEFVESISKTQSGKVKRFEYRD
ncbi:MAG: class I adenylate-forming enzyme family protein [Ignavibacteriales bacterium]